MAFQSLVAGCCPTLAFFVLLHCVLRQAELLALSDVQVDLVSNVGHDCGSLIQVSGI